MSGPRVSDHALLRMLERAGGLDVEALRQSLSQSLARAHEAAASIGAGDYLIRSNGLLFVVRGKIVTTVLDDGPFAAAHATRRLGQSASD